MLRRGNSDILPSIDRLISGYCEYLAASAQEDLIFITSLQEFSCVSLRSLRHPVLSCIRNYAAEAQYRGNEPCMKSHPAYFVTTRLGTVLISAKKLALVVFVSNVQSRVVQEVRK